ncbi:MAG: hypothetical protein RBT80_15905 [Candidatus Vecturithrix sp.]|nr:hypothetical protein [Candidatus Vecturithrix sp.]
MKRKLYEQLVHNRSIGICNIYEQAMTLQDEGKLHHGSGTFDYGDWAVWL